MTDRVSDLFLARRHRLTYELQIDCAARSAGAWGQREGEVVRPQRQDRWANGSQHRYVVCDVWTPTCHVPHCW